MALNLSLSLVVLPQTQNASSSPSETRQNEVTHRVQIQLLVASNITTAKTNYPSSLEAVVRQLKTSLAFKSHYLVATYLSMSPIKEVLRWAIFLTRSLNLASASHQPTLLLAFRGLD